MSSFPQVAASPYPWPFDGPLSTTTAALLLLGAQRAATRECAAHATIARLAALLLAWRGAGGFAIHGRRGFDPAVGLPTPVARRNAARARDRIAARGEEGWEIDPALAPIDGEPVIDHVGDNAFLGADLAFLLERRGVRNLVIGGLRTETVVHATMRAANDLGLECLLLEDGAASDLPGAHETILRVTRFGNGLFGTTGPDRGGNGRASRRLGRAMNDWSPENGSLEIEALGALYEAGTLAPSDVIDAVQARIAARGDDSTWIYKASRDATLARCRELEREGRAGRPLWGIPFSVKDCNDVPGMPTTNGLPESAYLARTTGLAISRLFDAGAICIGKTNMDQFGIGLVGTRTPYGACANAFDDRYISGGSSSGSAISVAAGLATFSIGNDAAGSGRVPAALNNIVGLKPTPGLVSNSCVTGGGCLKTAETVSVFALTVEDATAVLRVIAGYDPSYPFSKPEADGVDLATRPSPSRFRFGVPAGDALRFFGDSAAEALFRASVARLEAIGGERVEVDFSPFEETQRLLYDGPFIAERALALDPVLARHRERLHPVTRAILEAGKGYSAIDAFRAIHRVAELKCATRPAWDRIDALAVPSTPTIYTKAEVEAEPIALNARLGIYTNFANLMGLCAVAVPGGFRPDGLPQGLTLLAPSWREASVAAIGAAFQRAASLPLGATGNRRWN